MIGMIILLTVMVCIEYFKWQEACTPAPGSRSDASIIMGAKARFDAGPSYLLMWGFALFVCLIVLHTAYTWYGSFPILLVIVGVFVACFGFVRLRVPREMQGLVFGMIAMFTGFAATSFGAYLVEPGFTPSGLVPQIFANPVPLIFAVVILALPAVAWFRVAGFPFFRLPTEEELREPCGEELTISHPYDRVLERCREALTLLPKYGIDNDEPSYGLLEATVHPDQGRASTIRFTVEKIDDQKTRVRISIESPAPAFGNESGKRTYLNEKYLQVIDGYLRST